MQINAKSGCLRALLAMFIGVFANNVSGQLSAIHSYERAENVLMVSDTHDTLLYPFAGGLNSCQFANLDMDRDGTDDLLVFDRHGNRALPFLAVPSSPEKYHFTPALARLLPTLEQWMQAYDYDKDGRTDLFTYTTGGIKVFRNISESTLNFKQVTFPFLVSQQGSSLTNILVTNVDYPAIYDVDVDGDLDIITFWGLGSFLEWHRNTSMERFGTSDSLTFEKSSSCWGHFAEGNEDNQIVLDTCAETYINKSLSNDYNDTKHTGSTLLVHDMNFDGLPDITIGDVDFSTMVHLTNGGSVADAKMTSQTIIFPDSDYPVNQNIFPAAMLADANNDGRQDLLVSPFDPSLNKGENFESVSLYMDTSTTGKPEYSLLSNSFLQNQMLDLGSGAYPVLFDFNNDGLQDVLIGNYGYTDTCMYSPQTGMQCSYTARLALLINTGTASQPAFELVDRNIAHLDSLQMQSLIPSVADMDGDGDADLVCGNSKGKLVYCENIASSGQPAEFALSDPAWHLIDVGDFSAPQLFDIDNDGLTDLICGKRNGTLSFYKNTGTTEVADFSLVTDTLGGVDITNTQLSNYGYSVPCFYSDSQGNTSLFTGSEFGSIFVYDKIDGNLEGDFRLLGEIPGINEGWRNGICIGNLNNDTLTDMLTGNYSGGLGLFFGKREKIFGINDFPFHANYTLVIQPNPAQNAVSVYVRMDTPNTSGNVLIRSLDGKIVKSFSNLVFPATMEISDLNNGIYILSTQTKEGIAAGKLVICR